jgi:hypothetical protein
MNFEILPLQQRSARETVGVVHRRSNCSRFITVSSL